MEYLNNGPFFGLFFCVLSSFFSPSIYYLFLYIFVGYAYFTFFHFLLFSLLRQVYRLMASMNGQFLSLQVLNAPISIEGQIYCPTIMSFCVWLHHIGVWLHEIICVCTVTVSSVFNDVSLLLDMCVLFFLALNEYCQKCVALTIL